jgi:hypothetical protein
MGKPDNAARYRYSVVVCEKGRVFRANKLGDEVMALMARCSEFVLAMKGLVTRALFTLCRPCKNILNHICMKNGTIIMALLLNTGS